MTSSPSDGSAANMANASVTRRRILIIDDVVPESSLGAGYPRMIETITEIQSVPGAEVSLFPTLDIRGRINELGSIRPWTGALPLAIIEDDLDEHLAHKRAIGENYDLVIISRPHNYEYALDIVRKHLPQVPLIYDAEALFYRRLERQLEHCAERDREEITEAAQESRLLERKIAGDVDELVFVSLEEADLLRPYAKGHLSVNSPLLESVRWTPEPFEERDGVVFVASWSSGRKAPNVDGMQWFAREVWPRVLARAPRAKLRVTGNLPTPEVKRFACESIEFVGRVEDLNAFYGDARVVIVPNRFGAGVKNKTVEALQCGVPTVSTSIGAEGVPITRRERPDTSNGTDLMPFFVVTDEPTAFAESVVALLTDAKHWDEARSELRAQCDAWIVERNNRVWPSIIDRVAPIDVAENVGG